SFRTSVATCRAAQASAIETLISVPASRFWICRPERPSRSPASSWFSRIALRQARSSSPVIVVGALMLSALPLSAIFGGGRRTVDVAGRPRLLGLDLHLESDGDPEPKEALEELSHLLSSYRRGPIPPTGKEENTRTNFVLSAKIRNHFVIPRRSQV